MIVWGHHIELTKEQYFELKEAYSLNLKKAIFEFELLGRTWDSEFCKYTLNLFEQIYEPIKYS